MSFGVKMHYYYYYYYFERGGTTLWTTFIQTYCRFVLSVSRCVKAITIMTDIIIIKNTYNNTTSCMVKRLILTDGKGF